MTIKEIIDNSIIIGTCLVFVIMVITYIIWYLKDKLNKIQSYLREHKNVLANIQAMASYKALDEPQSIPKGSFEYLKNMPLKDIEI